MKLKRISKYNDTYIYTKAKKNWAEIVADINKNAGLYELSFCKPDEKEGIKILKIIEQPFENLNDVKLYAEFFIMWYLSC